jgi:hypothetical protein
MTSPITPAPWIHIDPTAAADAEAQAKQALQSLQTFFAQVGPEIIQLVVNAVLNAFGLSKIEGTVDELLAALESALSDIPQVNVHNLIAALGGVGGAVDQVLIDAIANALGHSGTGHTSSDILGYLEAIPFGNVTSILGLADLGADVQAVIDKIVNALGLSGTGHTLADLLAHLGAIPPANITAILGTTNLSTDIQGIVDNIANALGHTGTGHTLANILSYLGSIPNANITNILGSANLGADLQAVVDKIANGLGNTGTGHTLANLLSYMGGLAPVLGSASLAADLQAVVDKISNALGHTGTGHTLANLLSYLGAGGIPSANITNILGSSNLGADLQAVVDKIANGLGQTGTGHTLANLLTYMGGLAPVLGSASLGADVQAVVDKLANGLGQSGTGHTLANLLSYIGAIPNANITNVLGSSNLGADVQAIVDKLANGLGQSGTGHTLANLLTYIGAIPGSNIASALAQTVIPSLTSGWAGTIDNSRLTAILGSSNLGADLQAVVDKIANGLGQTGTGHTLANLLTYMGGLAPVLGSATLAADLQAVVDKISNALGHTGTGHTLANLLTYLGAGAIPNVNITNVLGGSSLGAELSALLSGFAATSSIPSQLSRLNITDVQSIIDAINQFFNPLATAGQAVSTLAANIETGLHSLLPAVVDNADGTGSLLSSSLVTLRSDGTAVFNVLGTSAANLAYTLVDALDGTAQTIDTAIQNIANSTHPAALTALSDVTQTLFGSTEVGSTVQYPALPNISIGGVESDIQSTFEDIVGPVSGAVTAGDVGAAIQAAVGGFFNLLSGHPLVGASVQSVNASSGEPTASYVAALNSEIGSSGGGSSGVSVSVDFSGYSNSSTLPGIFTETNTGGTCTLGISSGKAVYQTAGTTNTTCIAQYNVIPTDTDYQVVSIVFSGAGIGADYICARMNSAATSYVYAILASTGIEIGYVSGGTLTGLASTGTSAVTGNTYQLECGNPETGSLYEFNVFCNGAPVLSYFDTAHATSVGSSFRYAGFGITDIYQLGSWANVPSVASWAVYDNAPPAVIGSGFRQYLASTTQVNLVSGTNLLPNSYYDTNQWQSADLTYAAGTNNELTVSVAGWYMVKISLYTKTSGAGNNQLGPVLYHNGSVVQRGSLLVTVDGGSLIASDSFIVYCAAGDTLQPGSFTNISTFGTWGEATGTYSYWEVALMNCGTLS